MLKPKFFQTASNASAGSAQAGSPSQSMGGMPTAPRSWFKSP